jgi:hypothetical protein
MNGYYCAYCCVASNATPKMHIFLYLDQFLWEKNSLPARSVGKGNLSHIFYFLLFATPPSTSDHLYHDTPLDTPVSILSHCSLSYESLGFLETSTRRAYLWDVPSLPDSSVLDYYVITIYICTCL